MIEEHDIAMDEQTAQFDAALRIYSQRRRVRGDAWKRAENIPADLMQNIKLRLTRMEAIFEMEDMTSERVEAVLDDCWDLMNYAGFLARDVTNNFVQGR